MIKGESVAFPLLFYNKAKLLKNLLKQLVNRLFYPQKHSRYCELFSVIKRTKLFFMRNEG